MYKEVEFFKERVRVYNETFVLERVRNIDDLVDKITDELFNIDERLPYWAELWPSALALSEHILLNPKLFENRDILELGCGLGLTTLCLARCNPSELLATDYDQAALDITQKNFTANGLQKPDFELMDWRTPDLEKKYDVIVASDITYEERFFQPLIELFRNYLQPDGRIVIAEPNRAIARTFFGKLALNGFAFETKDKFVHQNRQRIKVTIYTIRFSNGRS